eukprot:NODE_715_length_1394_cov_525.460967_g540_i0.p1 GENE.NODE_715_length_1394_cov_525.460967_g540_i0~~NODE_715_length_1394_cov_525.460967_g540_i0.p1  ORF type:complete len:424 (+),score=89.14 NODE_715_length_1394_cov_525.460967_g540_i0:57-1274(+)
MFVTLKIESPAVDAGSTRAVCEDAGDPAVSVELLMARLITVGAPTMLVRNIEDVVRHRPGTPKCITFQEFRSAAASNDSIAPTSLCLYHALQPSTPRSAAEVFTANTRAFDLKRFRQLQKRPSRAGPQGFPFFCEESPPLLTPYRCNTIGGRGKAILGCGGQLFPNRSIVFFNTDQLKHLSHWLKTKRHMNHFFLLTSWSDRPIDKAFLPILNHPKLLLWFARERAVDHPKLHAIPIGILIGPARTIAALLQHSEPITVHPTHSLIAKFSIPNGPPIYRARREAAMVVFDAGFPDLRPAEKVARDEYFRSVLDHQFVLSPYGNAKDCYRTWEALYLGRSVVTLRSPMMDFIFQGLPVLRVDNYSQITPQLLNTTATKFDNCLFHMDKLNALWWWTWMLKMILLTP